MKIRYLTLLICAAAGPLVAPAAQIDPATLQSLKQELEDLRQRTRAIEEKINLLEKSPPAQAGTITNPAPAMVTSAPANAPDGLTNTTAAIPAAGTGGTNAPLAKKPWSASDPITVMRSGSAYMNMSFGAVGNVGWSTAPDKSLQLGDHDPFPRGFSLRNAELSLDGAVDPYFKGFANIALKLDQNNGTEIELEEVYLVSSSLPGNLQLKAGQFNAEFGRQNSQHPHQWAFVDQPLILNRAFGPEGLRNPGARLSWLAPTPNYTELSLGVFNGQGGTAFGFRDPEIEATHGRTPLDRSLTGPGDLLYVPRVSTSFDLTSSQTLVVGASGAFGPNDSGPESRTEIYGVDTYWKWKPANAGGGFPFVSWQNEALYRRYGADADTAVGLPAETLKDWGFYSQVLYGFHQGWVAGLRGEYVAGNTGVYDPLDVYRGERERVSPNITWYPSEFSKIRLQYNLDHGQLFDYEHSIWLQFEFGLGSHSAHKF
jgi:hypothetical protein